MTAKEFAEKCGVSVSTVRVWFNKGYVPGAKKSADDGMKQETWSIPEHAREPYTKSRAKKREVINYNILKAISNGYTVLPILFKISEVEFKEYINWLTDNRFITKISIDGTKYYKSTIKGEELLKKRRDDVIKLFLNILATAGALLGGVTNFIK